MGKNLKTILAIIGLLLIVGGTAAAIILVRQRQEIRKKAAVEEGIATVSLSPETASLDVGEALPVQINFNTGGKSISAISIFLGYSYSEDEPPLSLVGPIHLDIYDLISESFPEEEADKRVFYCGFARTENNLAEKKFYIKIGCGTRTPEGYSSTTDTTLASFTLQPGNLPNINPIILEFDPQQSIITRKDPIEDILLIPTSRGVYTITGDGADGEDEETEMPCDLTFNIGEVATLTPTSTSAPTSTATPEPTATSAPEPTATSVPEPTATPIPGATATPAPQPTPTSVAQVIPTPTTVRLDIAGKEPGFTLPTIGAILGGIVLIVGSLLLFF